MHLPKTDLQKSFITSFQQAIITEDHFTIIATCYQPSYANQEVVLIGSATGVDQQYYKAFARFLAEKGYIVYTFDYRGVGKSRPASLKDLQVNMQEWGMFDLDAVIKHIRLHYPYAKITYIAHSISGQLLSLTRQSSAISKVILVACQHVNWRLWPLYARFVYAFLVYVFMPVMSHIWGYYPGKLLKIFSDLPKGVALEWASWCRNRKGMFAFHSSQQLTHLQVPLLAIGFSDDVMAPFKAMKALLKRYNKAAVTHWQYSPREVGVKSIGHFGFFRARFRNQLWEPILEWVEQTERVDKPLIGSLFSNQMECMDGN